MSRVILTEGAKDGLERCRLFLSKKNAHASKRAVMVISKLLKSLESTPEIGRPLSDLPELRELIIAFGDSGYVVLYRYDSQRDVVYLLAFRHQKEAGYYS